MIRNGNVELQAREEEIRFIKMALNEEKRKQELLWKQLPNKRSLEEELVTLQIQLQQCQDRMLELEKHLEDPYDESRVRYLEGKDLPPAQLQDKVEDVSTRTLSTVFLLFEHNFRWKQTKEIQFEKKILQSLQSLIRVMSEQFFYISQ